MTRFRAPSLSSSSEEEEEDEVSSSSPTEPATPPARQTLSPSSDSESEDDHPYSAGDELEPSDTDLHEDELIMQPRKTQDAQVSLTNYVPPTLVNQDKRRVMQASFFGTKQPLSRKHSRDSDGGLGAASHRHSFDQPHNASQPIKKYTRVLPPPPPPPPPPEVTRIPLPVPVPASKSIFHRHGDTSSIFKDLGLSFGRSFRSGWGPRNLLARAPGLNSSTVHLHAFNTPATTETGFVRDVILPYFLTHSPKLLDEAGVPCITPKADKLTFASIASLFPPTPNYLRDIFKCGEALYDDLVPPIRSPLQQQLKRKKLLSRFLQSTLSQTATSFSRGSSDPAELAYQLLTTHRITKAADVAISGGYPRLALLISHAGSTDDAFRQEVREQLKIWRQEKGLLEHIEPGVRKCYALLSGDLDEMEQEGVIDDLRSDWKRFFGVLMWFVLPLDSSIGDVFQAYEELRRDYNGDGEGYVEPFPSYPASEEQRAKMKSAGYEDGTYILIKLFSSPFTTLSQVLHPRNFSLSHLDYGVPWVLSVLLGRVHGIRDFADREQLPARSSPSSENEETLQGHSPSADLLTASYVAQLEATGDLQEAVFVALFGEASAGRKQTIKALLSRNAHMMIPGVVLGLEGSLQIPVDWIGEAQALYHQSNGDLFNAYLKFLDAGRTSTVAADAKPNLQLAHRIALNHLSPPTLLTTKPDLDLLKSLFEVFLPFNSTVLGDEWIRGGQILLNYASILADADRLGPSVEEGRTEGPMIEDAVEKRDKEDLVKRCHRLLGVLPDTMMGWFGEDEKVKSKTELVKKRITLEVVKVLNKFGTGEKDLPKLSVIAPCAEDSLKLDVLRTGAGMRFLRSVGAI